MFLIRLRWQHLNKQKNIACEHDAKTKIYVKIDANRQKVVNYTIHPLQKSHTIRWASDRFMPTNRYGGDGELVFPLPIFFLPRLIITISCIYKWNDNIHKNTKFILP